MATTVVPAKTMARNARAKTLIQDAFHVLRRVIVCRRRSTVEKVSRRHLSRVTGNHDLLASRNRTNGIPRRDLRSLIEDDQVEKSQIGRKILRNRKRTHEHARGSFDRASPISTASCRTGLWRRDFCNSCLRMPKPPCLPMSFFEGIRPHSFARMYRTVSLDKSSSRRTNASMSLMCSAGTKFRSNGCCIDRHRCKPASVGDFECSRQCHLRVIALDGKRIAQRLKPRALSPPL